VQVLLEPGLPDEESLAWTRRLRQWSGAGTGAGAGTLAASVSVTVALTGTLGPPPTPIPEAPGLLRESSSRRPEWSGVDSVRRPDGGRPAMEIHPDIQIEDLVRELPESVRILSRHGIVCIRCGEPYWGTLRELASEKGITDLEPVLAELREAAGA